MRTTTSFLATAVLWCSAATFFFLPQESFGQTNNNLQTPTSVRADGLPPDASAILDVQSTDKGILVPRMTTLQRAAVATPATGLLVFDTDTGGFWFYNGTAWANLSAPKTLADADGNTKIQVEESLNEDIIRFDLGGTENMVLRKNASGIPRLELTQALNNTFVGLNAGQANTTGNNNTANGVDALQTNTTGFNNAAFGINALYSNTTGNTNVAVGVNALYTNTTGINNAATGVNALYKNTTGGNNTANGYRALFENTTGSYNTANGLQALNSNTTGTNNTATGAASMNFNTTGYNNSAHGSSALYANTTGTFNTASGQVALYSNSTGNDNTAFGQATMYSNTTGSDNTAFGQAALYFNTTGINNTATGRISLLSNTTGSANTANGHAALYSNTTGDANTAIGDSTLYFNKANSRSTAIGKSAMYYADDRTTGRETYNTAVGYGALRGSTTAANNTGQYNTAIGDQALFSNTTGSNNTGIGRTTDVSLGNLDNATAIGASSTVNASNKVRIGNGSVTVIEGQVDWTFPSDARFKFNVHDETVPGLAFINQLRPVTYQFDTRKFDQHVMQNMPADVQQRRMEGTDYSASTAIVQTGFLAQEVEQACKDLNFTFSGLHVPTSEVDNYGLAYGSFVPLLVKAVQEQQSLLRDLGVEIEKLKKLEIENTALKTQLDKITAALQGMGVELR